MKAFHSALLICAQYHLKNISVLTNPSSLVLAMRHHTVIAKPKETHTNNPLRTKVARINLRLSKRLQMKDAAAVPIPTTANLAGTCWPGPSILMTTPLMIVLVRYGPDFECLKSQLCIMRLRSFHVIIDVSTVFSYDAS